MQACDDFLFYTAEKMLLPIDLDCPISRRIQGQAFPLLRWLINLALYLQSHFALRAVINYPVLLKIRVVSPTKIYNTINFALNEKLPTLKREASASGIYFKTTSSLHTLYKRNQSR